ncbi:hypothetical protein [Mycobacterium sp. NPDC050041]|uniref:hypothetical protein n=1 Tax=Mycobacterium sp. NPDC050041 TaxID=3364293 RepID=UPI003C304FDE
MAGRSHVVDPDGVTWTVRRRWLPWRRAMALRELWHTESKEGETPETPAEAEESKEPANPVGKVLFWVLGIIIWAVIGIGKLLFIVVAVVLTVTVSVLDMLVQVIVLPIALAARSIGISRWPVQINREKLHHRTESAAGFDAAGELVDRLAAQIRAGEFTAQAS